MTPHYRLQQYQQQAVLTASPEHLILKLYDIGISACHRGDRQKVRKVLVELTGSLNFEKGGDLATRLYALYEYCILEAGLGDLNTIAEILDGLRESWREVVVRRKAAA